MQPALLFDREKIILCLLKLLLKAQQYTQYVCIYILGGHRELITPDATDVKQHRKSSQHHGNDKDGPPNTTKQKGWLCLLDEKHKLNLCLMANTNIGLYFNIVSNQSQ